jgi:ribosomal protein L37E
MHTGTASYIKSNTQNKQEKRRSGDNRYYKEQKNT